MTKTNKIIALIQCDLTDRVPAKCCDGPYEINRRGEIFNGKTGRKLKLHPNNGGYLFFFDYCNGVGKLRTVHRVSATTFVPNPHNYPEVNHINGDKTDNRPENLEWCTRSHNLRHSFRVLGRVQQWKGKVGNRKGKPRPEGSGVPARPVRGTHKKTGEVREFESIREAARQVGCDQGHICKVCQGKYKSSAGYRWEYVE